MFGIKNKKIISKIFFKTFIALIIFVLMAIPGAEVLAQTAAQYEQQGLNPQTGQPYVGRVDNTGAENQYTGAGEAVAGAVGTCSVGQILSNLVGSTVGTAINAITGYATGYVSGLVGGVTETSVPVNERVVRKNTGKVTFKETGGGEMGIVESFLSGISDVSLDSIGFCIANEMIRYIADSTIEWIKSGFKGKPVFIDNPEGFFQNLADQEAGSFIQQLVGGATGINVCAPFKVQLALDTIGTYNSGLQKNRRNGLNCTLSAIQNNYEQFVSGDFDAGGLPGWFELIQPQNNIYGAGQLATQEALLSVNVKQNTALINLNWAKGYRDFTVCDTGLDENGNCKPYPNGTPGERKTTLGGYIEHTVNSRADSAQHRLEIADEFDEIVSALINELIKIAINKAFESDGAN